MEANKHILNITGHLHCAYCSYQCISNENFQIHTGTCHPEHCEELDIGRLGKVVIYQRSAKLFHCQVCFFTGKTYTSVYDHVITSHSLSGNPNTLLSKNKLNENEESKVPLSGIQEEFVKEEKDKPETREDVAENSSEKVSDVDLDSLYTTPAKFTPLNNIKSDDQESGDNDSNSPDAPKEEKSAKRKKLCVGSEDQPVDFEDCDDRGCSPNGSSSSSHKHLEKEGSKGAAQDEEAVFLSKYVKRKVGRYYCKICNWRGKMKGFVLYHVSRKHNIPKPYACKECDKSFFLESLLNNHVHLHHKQGLYKCPYCPFESNFLRGIRKHLKRCSSQHGESADNELWDSDEQMDDKDEVS
ncbi:chromosome alignment-maintaining phosphoprotein 1-like [Polyodon spathula]|uniref:chromosome alignment-maintaining phosphoprotein 1-like n=1 Tax=Polyodon spathula TaxID=7913 RepID=UPI001B7E8A24|nr:chromosome alignment-maintaining phosphoprotein 1-like [Polyodon spathula]